MRVPVGGLSWQKLLLNIYSCSMFHTLKISLSPCYSGYCLLYPWLLIFLPLLYVYRSCSIFVHKSNREGEELQNRVRGLRLLCALPGCLRFDKKQKCCPLRLPVAEAMRLVWLFPALAGKWCTVPTHQSEFGGLVSLTCGLIEFVAAMWTSLKVCWTAVSVARALSSAAAILEVLFFLMTSSSASLCPLIFLSFIVSLLCPSEMLSCPALSLLKLSCHRLYPVAVVCLLAPVESFKRVDDKKTLQAAVLWSDEVNALHKSCCYFIKFVWKILFEIKSFT